MTIHRILLALSFILPSQLNTVNILTEAGVRTLVFSGEDNWKSVHHIGHSF